MPPNPEQPPEDHRPRRRRPRPGEGRYDLVIADDAEPGFRVRVLASGKKLFLFSYKVAGVSRRIPLGAFGSVTAAAARKQAERLRGEVRAGRDPWAERCDGRADALKVEAEARRRSEADAYTCAGCWTTGTGCGSPSGARPTAATRCPG